MPQIFHRSTNSISRITIILAVVLVSGLLFAAAELQRSPYYSWRGVTRVQPVPFSHEHHVGGLGIDCRYCHTTVETSSFANLPASKICMNCHSQMWAVSPELEPVRRVTGREGRSSGHASTICPTLSISTTVFIFIKES